MDEEYKRDKIENKKKRNNTISPNNLFSKKVINKAKNNVILKPTRKQTDQITNYPIINTSPIKVHLRKESNA